MADALAVPLVLGPAGGWGAGGAHAINKACTPAGETIPDDEQHLSLPLGVMEDSRFNLPLGQHRLCIQASNQDDVALQGPGMTRMIDVTIQSVDEPGNS